MRMPNLEQRPAAASAPPAEPAEDEKLADANNSDEDAKQSERPGTVGAGNSSQIDSEQAGEKRERQHHSGD